MFSTQQYSGFDPRTIPGCALWLDAADSRTLTVSANLVSSWLNKGLVVGSFGIGAGSEPTLTTSSNLPSIFFDGVNDRLNGSFSMANYIDAAEHTAFVVAMPTVVNTDSATTFSNDTIFGDTTGGYGIYLRSSGVIGTWTYDGTFKAVTTSYTPSNRVLVSSQHDSTNISLRLNGSNAVSTAAGSNTSLGFSRIGISASAVQQFYEGHIFEIITFTRSLSQSERQQVEGYLAWKWNLQSNLPTGHPFKPNPTAMRVFRPIDISGCNLWLDAMDKTTFTPANPSDGTGITSWSDKSGSNFTFSRTYGTTNATYNAASNSLFFSTSNAGYSSSHVASVNNETLFTVFTSTFNGTAYIIGATGSGGREVGTYVNWTRLGSINATVEWAAITPDGSMTGGARNLGVFTVSSSSNTAVAVNGGTFTSTTLANRLGSNARTTTLGVEGTTPTYSGHIHEVITYDRVLSTSERQQVEGYLATKWGTSGLLPSTQPYYLSRLLPSTSLFTPVNVSNCRIWLDAVDPNGNGSIPIGGSSITTWTDKSGSGKNFTATGTVTYNTSPSRLTLNGSSYLQNTTITDSVYTAFYVYQKTTNGPLFTTGTNSLTGLFPNDLIPAPTLYLARSDSTWYTQSSTIPNNTINIIVVQYDAANNIYLRYNGSLNAQSTVAGTITRDRLTLFYRSNNNEFTTGNLYEVVYHNTGLTTAQIQQVEGYLAWKWGLQNNLPTTHPYYKFRP